MSPLLLLLFAFACGCVTDSGADPLAPTLDATLTPSAAVGTVATVTVETPSPATVVVEATEPDGALHRFAARSPDGVSHRALLVGLPAGVDLIWRAVATLEDGEVRASNTAIFESEVQPLWLPALTLAVGDEPSDASDTSGAADTSDTSDTSDTGPFLITTILGQAAGAALVDHQGRYVWWWQPEFGTIVCQARMAADGESVLLYLVDGAMQVDIGAIVRVALTGETLSETRVELGHHDFLEAPDGRVAAIAYESRVYESQNIAGDRVVLVDLETGDAEPLWSTWDDLLPGNTQNYPVSAAGLEWTHANGIARDAETGEWLVSLHNIDTVVKLTPDGELAWTLGGEASDFTLTSGEPFAVQHAPSFTEDGILLFDNRAPRTGDLYSRAVEYHLDEAAGTYTSAWTYDGGQELYAAFMGSAERLPNGGTLIGWGSAGRLEEIDATGALTWQLEVEIGSLFGFSHRVETLGAL